jgi:hypothetical protein
MAAAHWREDASLPADLRDMLTRARLAGAVANLAGIEIVEFDNDWWDGQSHAPCLVVRGGRRHRLLRVVETAGEAVVVPFERRTAQRWLADRRRPEPQQLGIPAQRREDDVVVDASVDAVRCETPTCGAMLPVDQADGCPLCGGVWVVDDGETGVSDEKSTATGARTAGSSASK